MKKMILLTIAAVVFFIGVAGLVFALRITKSSADDKISTGSLGSKSVNGALVIGLDDAFPPIGFRDEKGELTGFDVEMAKEACRRMGLTPKFQPVVWDTVIMSLNNKDIDVIWNGMTVTEKRKEQISFSNPYLRGENVFLVDEKSDILSIADLKGKTVAAQSGSQQEEVLNNDPLSKSLRELRTYETIQAAILDMKTGRIDAVLVDNFAGLYTAKQVLGESMKVRSIKGGYGENFSAVGLRKQDGTLRSRIDEVLKEMGRDGTTSKIAFKWFGDDGLIVK